MTVHRTAALAASRLGSSAGSHSRGAARRPATIPPGQGGGRARGVSSTRPMPGQGWSLAAAATGVAHAGVVVSDGAWPTIGLAAATVLLAAVWPWLLTGHRQDLSGALGVVWVAVAAVSVGLPAAALLATAAGVAALVAACSIR